MLVSELIDRTLAEWLLAGGDERPSYDFLSEDIDASTLEIQLEGRVEHTPRDSFLEIGSELILTKSVSGSVVTGALRGASNSTATTHSAGDLVTIDPTFTRVEILNALRAIIGKLYPWGVYHRIVEEQTLTRQEIMVAPDGAKKIHSITVTRPTSVEDYEVLRQRGTDWVEFTAFDPVKFRMGRRGSEGSSIYVVAHGDWELPTTEDVDLTAEGSLELPETLAEDLPMAVAGQVLKGREVPQATIDRIRELIAKDTAQRPGNILNVGETLIGTFRRDAVAAERRRLSALDPPAFEWQAR